MTHELFILAYDGCQLLDVAGPAAVFGAANEASGEPVYDLQIVSAEGGLVTSNCGVVLQSKKIGGQPDTLLVAGGALVYAVAVFVTRAYSFADLRAFIRRKPRPEPTSGKTD